MLLQFLFKEGWSSLERWSRWCGKMGVFKDLLCCLRLTYHLNAWCFWFRFRLLSLFSTCLNNNLMPICKCFVNILSDYPFHPLWVLFLFVLSSLAGCISDGWCINFIFLKGFEILKLWNWFYYEMWRGHYDEINLLNGLRLESGMVDVFVGETWSAANCIILIKGIFLQKNNRKDAHLFAFAKF